MTWPSGHLGLLENIQGSSDTSGITLWHAGTLACWHSRQTHSTGKLMMITTLSICRLMAHTDVVGLQDDGVDVDVGDAFSESEQAVNQSTLSKLAQPHKPKINPNFEI